MKKILLLISLASVAVACTEIVVQPLTSDTPPADAGSQGVSVDGSVASEAAPAAPRVVNSVSSGTAHTCALMSDGTVQCWGDNSFGELGDGTFAQRLTPIRVEGISGVRALSAGYTFTCAVLNDGTVKCWGDNAYGQLGDGSTTAHASPVTVRGLENVLNISTGLRHACALLSDGTAKCWGANGLGQLGDGTTNDQRLAVPVSGLSAVRELSAAWDYSCAVLLNGTASCWGVHEPRFEFLFGDAAPVPGQFDVLPTALAGFEHVDSLATGSSSLCALAGGTVTCKAIAPTYWFGYHPPPEGDLSQNVFVPKPFTGATAVSAHGDHVCALLANGKVTCWGCNDRGQLGDGTTEIRNTPVELPNLEDVKQMSSGGLHSCARLSSGRLSCWGSNWAGALGTGDAIYRLAPTLIQGGLSGVKQVAIAGDGSTLFALLKDGTVRCWGSNDTAQCGLGSASGPILSPVAIPSLSKVNSISVTPSRVCVTIEQSVWCWGDGSTAPSIDVGLADAQSVVVLSGATCAMTLEGAVRCRLRWSDTAPALVPGLTGVQAIAGGGSDAFCALLADGTVRCATPYDNVLRNPNLGAGPTSELAMDGNQVCALSAGGTVSCTDALSDNAVVEYPIYGQAVKHVFMGGQRACATLANGTTSCWGDAPFPTFGEWFGSRRVFASRAPELDGMVSYGFAYSLSCGIDAAGSVSCWGFNGLGVVSGSIPKTTPTSVTLLP